MPVCVCVWYVWCVYVVGCVCGVVCVCGVCEVWRGMWEGVVWDVCEEVYVAGEVRCVWWCVVGRVCGV